MIRITATWWQGVYTGSAGDGHPEWPPSPYRIYAALVAGAHRGSPEQTAREREAMQRLARHRIATIWVPRHTTARLPGRYVPTSSMPVSAPGKDPNLAQNGPAGLRPVDTSLVLANVDSRSKAAFLEVRTSLAHPDVVFDVQDDDDPLTDDDVAALHAAALRVPYVGRATHAGELSIARGSGLAPTPDHHRWSLPQGGARPRTWDEGTLDALDRDHAAVFHHGLPPSPPAHRARRAMPPPPGQRTRTHLVTTIRLGPARASSRDLRGLGQAEAVRLVEAANRVVQELEWGTQKPPRIVAVPDVARPHATGRVLRLGIVAEEADSAYRLVRKLPEALGDVLDPAGASTDRPSTHRRWTASSAHWFSATPFVGHPDERVARLELARDLADACGGVLKDAALSRTPLEPGQVPWPTPPGGAQRWWVTLQTTSPVEGPLVLGRQRTSGYGLFANKELP